VSLRQRSIVWVGIVAFVAIPWVVLAATIPWNEQDFPLIDDWAYSRGAYSFCRGEGIDYQSWSAVPALGLWSWSKPFLMVFGESHNTLRLSTIVLSWLGLWGFYDLIRRRANASPPVAAFATACLGWNPFFFMLSGTYMTDVPSLAFGLITLAVYGRALESGRLLTLAAATALGLVAVATRQNALGAPMAAGILMVRSPFRTRPLWVAGIVIPIVAGFAIHAWLKTRSDVAMTSFLQPRLPGLEHAAWLGFTGTHYLGLMAAPVLLLLPSRRSWKVFTAALVVMTVGAVTAAVFERLARSEGVFPYLEDVITASGPYAMRDTTSRPPVMSWEARLIPTILGCVFGAELIARAVAQGIGLWARPLVVFSMLQFSVAAIAPFFRDRYLLMLVPGALEVAVLGMTRPRWRLGLTALVFMGMLSVCLMHDWLSYNAARWSLGRRAIARGIDPGEIHAGFEWDYWYPRKGLNRYVLTLEPSSQHSTIDSERFTFWLPPRRGVVYLQRYIAAAVRPPGEEP
jgi:hypothetical protein